MIAKKKEKRNFNQENFSYFIFIFLIFALLFLLAFYNFKINQRRQGLISQIEELERSIEALEERNLQIRAGISQAETDSYWEEIARQQGFIKEGEEQVVVLPPESQTIKEKEEKVDFWNPQSWWEEITKWFNRERD